MFCVDSPDCLRHLALDGARADCGHEAPGGRRAGRRVDVGEVILNTLRYITSRQLFRGVSCRTDPTLLYTFSCLFCIFLWFCLFIMFVYHDGSHLSDILWVAGCPAPCPAPAPAAGADLPLNTLGGVWLWLRWLLLLLLLLQLDLRHGLLLGAGQVAGLEAHVAGHHAGARAAVGRTRQGRHLRKNIWSIHEKYISEVKY